MHIILQRVNTTVYGAEQCFSNKLLSQFQSPFYLYKRGSEQWLT